ncbi:hypothetical protein [Haloarchaeobius amylolyticus]|uniref:hypothetical protein n=1 Tax=Haloarchaeobius amylolyticus TaxID=1198296 RepID=UPI002271CB08|nr:hypothetical protein [Haloarchaeobius amylolyticus]
MYPASPDDIDTRLRGYWWWLGAVLFVLVALDLGTTLVAAQLVGVEGEANPIVRWALEQGVHVVVLLNLVAVVLVVGLFSALLEAIRDTPARVRGPFLLLFELWIAALLLLGVFLVANNMTVIVAGASLL